MKQLINFIKQNKGLSLAGFAVVVLTPLLLILAPAKLESIGVAPTATAIVVEVLATIAVSVVTSLILTAMDNNDDR